VKHTLAAAALTVVSGASGCAYPTEGVEEITVIGDAICGEGAWIGDDSSGFRKAEESDLFPSTVKYRYSVICLGSDDRDRGEVAEEVAALVGASLRAVERERGRVNNPDYSAGTWSSVSIIGGKDSLNGTTRMNFYEAQG